MNVKKMTVCLTCFRSRLVSSNGRIKSIAAPVVPMKLASTAADGEKRRVGHGMGGQVALDANPAADGVQAEQQDDERNVFAQDRVGQHLAGLGKVEPAGRRQRDVRRGPMGLQADGRAASDSTPA